MTHAIILAAGNSTRFGKNKLLAPILGKPLFYYPLQALHDHPGIDEVHIVTNLRNQKSIRALVKRYHFPKVKTFLQGGTYRQQSLIQAFSTLKKCQEKDIILVHNGANPLITAEEITAVLKAVKKNGAAAVGHPMVDTVKEIEHGHFSKTHPRKKLIAMQTPQAAHHHLFVKAIAKAKKYRKIFTDETSLLEYSAQKVKFVQASTHNFKITVPRDLEQLKTIMGDTPEDFLVGFGQDSHEFEATKKGMWLGGIYLKNEPECIADSDGDVILHALCNAISQALGQMSLGHFATPLFKGKNIKNSKTFLKVVLKKMHHQKYTLNNLGLMLEGKAPLIDPLVSPLKKSLSALLKLRPERIGITATTGKSLTSFGQGKGLQCFAIVSLKTLKSQK